MQGSAFFRFLQLLLAAPLVVACAHPVSQWAKAGATPEQIQHDKAECKYQIDLAQSGHHSDTVVSHYNKKVTEQVIGNAIGDGIADAERGIELMNECMSVRGYTAVK